VKAAGVELRRDPKASGGRRLAPVRMVRRILRAARDVISVPDPFIWWALRAGGAGREFLGDPLTVIASGPPHSSLMAGALVARRTGRPLILDFRDEWSLNPYYRKRWPLRLLVERSMEAWCVHRAGALVFVSDVSARRYRKRYPEVANRVRVIPNGYDPADLSGLPVRRSRRPDDPVVICHAGSLHGRRDPEPFLEALRRVLARREAGLPRVELLLLGVIGDRQAAAARRAIPPTSLRIEAFVPHAEAISRAAASDVLLVITNSEEAGPAALTGKVFEYLALRRPILAITPAGPAAELIRAAAAGVSADPRDLAAIERSIEAALALAEEPEFKGAGADYLAQFDRRRQAVQWAALAVDVAKSATR
jgi:glycosyltransferase involved in cell wall biosynthesis